MKKIHLIALTAFISASQPLAIAQSTHSTNKTGYQQTASKHYKSYKPNTVAVKIVEPERHDEDSAKAEKKARHQEAREDRIADLTSDLMWSTLVLAIATLILAVVSFSQLKTLKVHAVIFKEQAGTFKEHAGIFEGQATTLVKLVENIDEGEKRARDKFIRELRAYVVSKNGQTFIRSPTTTNPMRWVLTLPYVNIGKTPAKNISIQWWFGEKQKDDFTAITSEITPPFDVGSGFDQSFSQDLDLSFDYLEIVKGSVENRIRIFIRFVYDDIFGGIKRHTNLCFDIVQVSGGFILKRTNSHNDSN